MRPKTITLLAAALAATTPPATAQDGPADLPVVSPIIACADLLAVDLAPIGGPGSAVTGAEETTSDGISVCSVTGTLVPTIGFQVLLPVETWTQRYLQVGCGGLCGSITLRSGASAGCAVLEAGGFAMAATDMGHAADDEGWGLDPRKREDFAHRAQHLTAEASKALIAAFYGQAPRWSYFNGCSDGGREALMAAMRHPADFDGVIAGAPAAAFTVQNTLYHGWQATANRRADGTVILTSDKLPVLHAAALAACDADDGLADGLISQPAACDFDPHTPIGQGLTGEEAAAAARLYGGPMDPDTGARLTPGGPLPGSELEWQGVFVTDAATDTPFSERIVLPVLRTLAFEEPRPDATLADFAFTEATLAALRPRHRLFDATNPDLSAFAEAGGKLIVWHGLADADIAPSITVALWDAIGETLGETGRDAFARLYLLPGVGHCGSDRAPGAVNMLGAMMAWVERGDAPDAILARTGRDAPAFGQPDLPGQGGGGRPPMMALDVPALPAMTRPVYPYPYTARFTGTGDWTDAASWERGGTAPIVATWDWAGADWFTPYDFAGKEE